MEESFYKKLGRRIADLRAGKGLSQESLAAETELSSSYIARIEVGARRPTLDALGEIADACQVPIWRLLADEQMASPQTAAVKELQVALQRLSAADVRLLVQLAKRLARP